MLNILDLKDIYYANLLKKYFKQINSIKLSKCENLVE